MSDLSFYPGNRLKSLVFVHVSIVMTGVFIRLSDAALVLSNHAQIYPRTSAVSSSNHIPHILWIDGNMHSSGSLPRFEYVRFYGS